MGLGKKKTSASSHHQFNFMSSWAVSCFFPLHQKHLEENPCHTFLHFVYGGGTFFILRVFLLHQRWHSGIVFHEKNRPILQRKWTTAEFCTLTSGSRILLARRNCSCNMLDWSRAHWNAGNNMSSLFHGWMRLWRLLDFLSIFMQSFWFGPWQTIDCPPVFCFLLSVLRVFWS